MTNFVNNIFYFFTDEDYALLLSEYNEIISKNLKSAVSSNIAHSK